METDSESVQCRDTPVSESDWDERECLPSVAIVDAVARAEGVEPAEMESVATEIDLNALDQLLLNAAPGTCGTVSLSVAGWNVFVSGNGPVVVCDPSETPLSAPVFDSASAG